MENTITIKNLTVEFQTAHGSVKAVHDVNTVFEAGKITGLIGESGSGKSVLGMSILKLLPATAKVSGSCFFQGRDLYRLKEAEIRKFRGKEIALIPQNPSESLNPVRKIGPQLMEAMTVHDRTKKKEAALRMEELLLRFGFQDPETIKKQYSFQLSGGMNQRIISVLGLMNHPGWMIADEPTKGLDAILRSQVYGVLKSIVEENHSNMIIITHDILLAEKLCDEIRVLYAGELLEQGKTEEVFHRPKHPYTKGLIHSLPSKGMKPIGGIIPGRKPGPCKFYERCSVALPRCLTETPRDFKTENGSLVRCFLYA